MKKYIIGIIIGLILACGVAYATEILMDAGSASYTSEYTNKTNVADVLTELLEGGTGCPKGFTCSGNVYVVTYDALGGSVSKENKKITYNQIYGELPTPTKEGYTFGGWFLDEQYKQYVNENTRVKINANHTLYAMWGSSVEVSFEANGGFILYNTKTVAYHGRYGQLPHVYKEGYVLEGWYLDQDFTSKVTESSSVNQESSHTLYAKWTEGTEYDSLYDIVASKLNKTKQSQSMTYNAKTTDLGVYEYNGTKSSDGGDLPVYFYRGAVTNNNVLFAGYCWKMIRTTATGGVKLIYNGTSSQGQCNGTNPVLQVDNQQFNAGYTAYTDSYYVFKTGNIHGVSSDSKIKTYIEQSWFNSSNFVDTEENENAYYDLLEDTPFCIDRRYSTSITTTTLTNGNSESASMCYGSWVRAYNNLKPSLDCYHSTNSITDRLTVAGGQLTKKVGMITVDEVRLAGGGRYADNTNFLYTGTKWWTISPEARSSGDYPHTLYIESNGTITAGGPQVSRGVRPVVSLSVNAKVTGGNGDASTPYKID